MQAIATTTWLDHGPTEIEADGHVVRDIVETQKVVEVCVWMRDEEGRDLMEDQ